MSITARTYNAWTLVQGFAMVIGGIFVYLALGYWLTGKIDGPTIPVIHMDLAPLIALILVLVGGVTMLQVYVTRPGGTINFQGEGLQFSFPFRGTDAQNHVYELVNAAFLNRHDGASDDSPPGEAEKVEEGGQVRHFVEGDRSWTGDRSSAEE